MQAYDYARPVTAIRALGDVAITAWKAKSQPIGFAYSAPLTRGSGDAATRREREKCARPTGSPICPLRPFRPTFLAIVRLPLPGRKLWSSPPAKTNFHETVKHLEVEQRQLTEPVTLDYPTFASAAEASGISRVWAGIHWPADSRPGTRPKGRGIRLAARTAIHSWHGISGNSRLPDAAPAILVPR
jgi:hypothetical protein